MTQGPGTPPPSSTPPAGGSASANPQQPAAPAGAELPPSAPSSPPASPDAQMPGTPENSPAAGAPAPDQHVQTQANQAAATAAEAAAARGPHEVPPVSAGQAGLDALANPPQPEVQTEAEIRAEAIGKRLHESFVSSGMKDAIFKSSQFQQQRELIEKQVREDPNIPDAEKQEKIDQLAEDVAFGLALDFARDPQLLEQYNAGEQDHKIDKNNPFLSEAQASLKEIDDIVTKAAENDPAVGEAISAAEKGNIEAVVKAVKEFSGKNPWLKTLLIAILVGLVPVGGTLGSIALIPTAPTLASYLFLISNGAFLVTGGTVAFAGGKGVGAVAGPPTKALVGKIQSALPGHSKDSHTASPAPAAAPPTVTPTADTGATTVTPVTEPAPAASPDAQTTTPAATTPDAQSGTPPPTTPPAPSGSGTGGTTA